LGTTVSVAPADDRTIVQGAWQVPIGALFDAGNGPGVWIISGEPAKVSWRPVAVLHLDHDGARFAGPLDERRSGRRARRTPAARGRARSRGCQCRRTGCSRRGVRATGDPLDRGSDGRIDVLVNNAGMSMLGAVEETAITEAASLFDTPVFGVLRTIRRYFLTCGRSEEDGS
jgi:NAD(P)-dependent dehydrogenase (short-subunit alcohol dehydrogenase family)